MAQNLLTYVEQRLPSFIKGLSPAPILSPQASSLQALENYISSISLYYRRLSAIQLPFLLGQAIRYETKVRVRVEAASLIDEANIFMIHSEGRDERGTSYHSIGNGCWKDYLILDNTDLTPTEISVLEATLANKMTKQAFTEILPTINLIWQNPVKK
jgi:hypothetical protein